ncbi:hypothetical protein [Ruminiclostridium cellobioparum]|uniref:Uncharacterized protein n=1 Tax=Ruminiclostridium cellobioparum subsp. termitidis CT1112 TaxID=1195236 RepID=S0FQ75_RUMCE|nr:hypothetical protein [Ruminiclostridium cellobioparum]EMS74012.1 hypothetical protein CTER_5131 [Ruminiclostridium cellobioparum subsp. termitidis CT1112]
MLNGYNETDKGQFDLYIDGDKYNVTQLSARKWKITKDQKFFCYMKAFDIKNIYETLSRFVFDEDSEQFQVK